MHSIEDIARQGQHGALALSLVASSRPERMLSLPSGQRLTLHRFCVTRVSTHGKWIAKARTNQVSS